MTTIPHACESAGCWRAVWSVERLCDECRKDAERREVEQAQRSAIQAAKGWRGRRSNGNEYRLRARTGGGDE